MYEECSSVQASHLFEKIVKKRLDHRINQLLSIISYIDKMYYGYYEKTGSRVIIWKFN